MSLHLQFCRHADLVAPESEIRETARLLDRGWPVDHDEYNRPVELTISPGTRNAELCGQALRRLVQ